MAQEYALNRAVSANRMLLTTLSNFFFGVFIMSDNPSHVPMMVNAAPAGLRHFLLSPSFLRPSGQ